MKFQNFDIFSKIQKYVLACKFCNQTYSN